MTIILVPECLCLAHRELLRQFIFLIALDTSNVAQPDLLSYVFVAILGFPTTEQQQATSDIDEAKKVIVVDLQMPFFSIVVLMVKWALASIPAISILATILSIVSGLMGGMLFPRFEAR